MPTPQQVQSLLNQVERKKELDRAEAKHKETNDKLDNLNESIKGLGLKDSISAILDEVKNIKVEVPTVEVKTPDINIPEIKLPDIKVTVPEIKIPEIKVPEVKVNVEAPIVNVNNPDEVKVKEPNWLNKLINPVVEAIKNKVIPTTVFPKTASEAIPVRLSNGKKFYEVFSNLGTQIGGAVDTSDLAKEAKQLPDGHEVEVNNFPTEYPLPASQVTTLTPPAAITGFATSAKQLPDNHQVTVSNIANTPVITGFATSANQTNGTQASMFVNELGVPYGVKHINYKPRVSAMPYTYDIAEGNVPDHIAWSKIGYSPAQTANVNTDVWSYSATQPVYLFPTAAIGMEVTSSSAVDVGTIIHSGNSTGGSITSLISTGENFNTTTAVGDCVILDKSGASPEYGFITAIVSDTQITIGGGFNHGGSGSGRAYSILDESATAGGHAVEITYLDGAYAEKREIVILNGNAVPAGVIATVNTDIFRVNAFRIIAAGVNKVPTGNISLRNLADTPVYSYITAGFNRARNSMYTVPAGKSLYVVEWHGGFGTTGKASREYARITTRANIDPTTRFRTDSIFYPFTDIISSGEDVIMPLPIPTKLPAKTDIKVSAVTSETGVITSVLRGWLEVE